MTGITLTNQELAWINEKANQNAMYIREAGQGHAQALANGDHSSIRATNANDSYVRSLGTTLTGIYQNIFQQKYFTVAPADFMPVISGEIGAYYDEYKVFGLESFGDRGSSGWQGAGGSNDTRSSVDELVMSELSFPINRWKYAIKYTLHELNRSAANQQVAVNLIQTKEAAVFKKYQLEIQKMAFLGVPSAGKSFEGLITQSGVVTDAVTIADFLYTLNDADFDSTIQNIITTTKQNLNRVEESYPNTFVIPEAEADGLRAQRPASVADSSVFRDRLELLESKMKRAFGENFQVKSLSYCDKSRNDEILNPATGFNRYVLYRNDRDSLMMQIPLNYTTTPYATSDNYVFNSVAYAQASGCNIIRSNEIRYFDHTA